MACVNKNLRKRVTVTMEEAKASEFRGPCCFKSGTYELELMNLWL